jgi:hypothetical protein
MDIPSHLKDCLLARLGDLDLSGHVVDFFTLIENYISCYRDNELEFLPKDEILRKKTVRDRPSLRRKETAIQNSQGETTAI